MRESGQWLTRGAGRGVRARGRGVAPWLLAALALALPGCSAVSAVVEISSKYLARVDLRSVGVESTADANENSATALDLLFVYDESIVAQLPTKAPEWFRDKNALIAQTGEKLEVVELTLPPMSRVDEVALPGRHRSALDVFAFASYRVADGQARLSLGEYEDALIRLEGKAIKVVSR